MKSLLTVEDMKVRLGEKAVPLLDDGNIDEVKIQTAIDDATGIIVSQLPWLIDSDTGDIVEVIPVQFNQAVRSFCADIAVHRMSDTVSSSEDEREWFKTTMGMIEKIDSEYKGGLSGPNGQESFIVEADEGEGIPDTRFFKKGRLF